MSSDLYERALEGPSIPLTRTTSRFLEFYRTSVEMKLTIGTVYKSPKLGLPEHRRNGARYWQILHPQ